MAELIAAITRAGFGEVAGVKKLCCFGKNALRRAGRRFARNLQEPYFASRSTFMLHGARFNANGNAFAPNLVSCAAAQTLVRDLS